MGINLVAFIVFFVDFGCKISQNSRIISHSLEKK